MVILSQQHKEQMDDSVTEITGHMDPPYNAGVRAVILDAVLTTVKAGAFVGELGALTIHPVIQQGLADAGQQVTLAKMMVHVTAVLWGSLMSQGAVHSALWMAGLCGWFMLTQHHVSYLCGSVLRVLRSLRAVWTGRPWRLGRTEESEIREP